MGGENEEAPRILMWLELNRPMQDPSWVLLEVTDTPGS